MLKGIVSHLRKQDRAQAMVEFVIALPILLFVIFGIIEFARMTFAWMAVQNAARFGIRYAVTGEYDETYCVEAGNLLGATHVNADIDGGDPQDCKIPDSYTGANPHDLERDLIDMARLFSIQDAAVGGGAGLWLRPNVSGNYEQYLDNHNESFIGLPSEQGFYNVTVCSNRENQFGMDYSNHAIPLCKDLLSSQLMDDAGGPGDRVKVRVEHRHPLFLPLLTNIWPSVTLNAERDGIVEKFRTSRVIGVSGPILSAPTWTQTPTITLTPSVTPTPTETYTPTPTDTSTPTNTPIPVDCDLINIVDSEVAYYGLGYFMARMSIQNTNPVPIHLFQANQGWEKNLPSRKAYAFKFNGSAFDILDDDTPPTIWVPLTPIELASGDVGDYIALFKPPLIPIWGTTSIDLEFEDSCHKVVAFNAPSPTITDTPTETATPTMTPTPDCSKYSMTGFSFDSFAIQRMWITNGDVVDTTVSQIQFDWNYAENYGVINGYPNLNVDYFEWPSGYFFGGGSNDGVKDSSSPSNWSGSLPFNQGSTYEWEIDFDGDWGGGGSLSGVVNNDFGVIIDFANGCQLRRDAVPRSIASWTPSPTPTTTPTPSPIPPPTSTPLPTNTPPPTATPLPTWTFTPTLTPSDTSTPTITLTPSDTPIPPTASDTPVPTDTPVPSDTPIPTETFTPVPTNSPTPTKTFTPTPIPTWTPRCGFDHPDFPCQPSWTPTP